MGASRRSRAYLQDAIRDLGIFLTIMPIEIPLGRYLQMHWKALGITQAASARRVSMFSAHIQQIRVGRRKPPLRALLRWAAALDLHAPSDIDRLLELMQLGHALPVTQEAYERMRSR